MKNQVKSVQDEFSSADDEIVRCSNKSGKGENSKLKKFIFVSKVLTIIGLFKRPILKFKFIIFFVATDQIMKFVSFLVILLILLQMYIFKLHVDTFLLKSITIIFLNTFVVF